ncbi:hypothetical protein HYS31_03665, partial [Candidatus Woesearchaeota archaeon]|nr:hypothetical protein [Candidatus Woesearchaeota archaeon]
MRFAILVIMLALLAMNANASWQTYQHDLRNTGLANGSGYFPAATANYSLEGVGMNFQPLVGDLDGNGNNEIII